MFTRWIYLALAIALMAAIGVHADDDGDVICGDLAQADCQILRDNMTVMETVSSFAFNMSMTLDLALHNSDDATSLSVDGQGALAIDPDTMAMALEMEEQIENSTAMSLSADEIAQLDSLFAGLTGDITADIHLVAAGESTQSQLHLLIHDAIVVLNAGALGDLMDQPMDGMDWIGLDASGLLSLLSSDPGMSEWLGTGANGETPGDADTWADVEEAATSVVRLDDSEVNGVTVAVFESAVDLSLIADMLVGLYEGMDTLDQAEIDATRQQLTDGTLIMRQFIGMSDHYTYRTELSLEMGAATAQAEAGAMSMTMTLDQSDFNTPVEVAIPQDAFILPLAMMMQMGG